ncbi:hypothetical protein B0H14DRAFT_381277 [Mycena olivaceomarginata]|nr:hypothetical protein B0H14DRAFT_381277 [Mycena olivaceomarginata]
MSSFVSPTTPSPGATMVFISATITGPTLLGILFNWGLMGVLAVQLYLFYENSKDRTAIKALVYGLALLDILQTVMVTADAFHWFVYGFNDHIQLDEPFLNPWDVPVIDSVISLIVQAFYCWRIYIIRQGVFIPVLIVIVSITQFAAGIVTGVENYKVGRLSLSSEHIVPETIWLAGGAVADVCDCWGDVVDTLKRTKQLPFCTQPHCTLAPHPPHRRDQRPHRRRGCGRYCAVLVPSWYCAGLSPVRHFNFYFSWGRSIRISMPRIAIIGKLYTNCLFALFNNRTRLTAKSVNSHDLVSLRVSPNSALNKTSSAHFESLQVHVVSQTDMSHESRMENGNIGVIPSQKT